MVIALDSLQPTFDVPAAEDVPDEDIDKPRSGVTLVRDRSSESSIEFSISCRLRLAR